MKGAGKVTPESVAPSEPTIDTTLMTIPIAGKSENRNTAKHYVATTNRAEVRFSGQNPHENGMRITPNST